MKVAQSYVSLDHEEHSWDTQIECLRMELGDYILSKALWDFRL